MLDRHTQDRNNNIHMYSRSMASSENTSRSNTTINAANGNSPSLCSDVVKATGLETLV